MKFKIGEISKLSGFSPSGIRFFEEAGVVSPVRGMNEKYREYSLEDLQRLLICRKFRECGFSLEESVEMLRHADIQELKVHISRQADCIKHSLMEKQALLEYLNQQITDIDQAGENPVCEITQMPALYWFKLWQPGDLEEDIIPFSVMYEWIERGPFTNSCLLLPHDELLSGQGDLATMWGTAIEEKFAQLLNFQPHGKTTFFQSCEAIRKIILPTASLTIPSGQLDSVREFVTSKNLRVSGPALSRFFYSRIKDGHLVRYDHLWIPIERL